MHNEKLALSSLFARLKPCIVKGIFLGMVFLAGPVCASPPADDTKWLACKDNADCTSVELGCWHWAPVNKAYTKEMQDAHFMGCKKSTEPGPQPTSSCVAHVCVNDPYTVAFWPKLIGAPQQNAAIDKRIEACLHAANMDWPAAHVDPVTHFTDFPAAELSYFFFQKVDGLMRRQTYAASLPLDSAVESAIACDEVVARAKSPAK